MPVLGLTEQRLHPDAPLAQGLLVGGGRLQRPRLLPVGLIKGPVQPPALSALSAAVPDWTARARRGGRLIGPYTGDVVVPPKRERLALRTPIRVRLTVVGELGLMEERAGAVILHHGHVPANVALGQGAQVLTGGVLAIEIG